MSQSSEIKQLHQRSDTVQFQLSEIPLIDLQKSYFVRFRNSYNSG